MLYNVIHNIRPVKNKIFCNIALIIEILAYVGVFHSCIILMDSLSAIFFIIAFYLYDNQTVLSNQKIVELGKRSLAIYLLHYPIVVIVGSVLKKIAFLKDIYMLEMLFLLTLSLLSAYIWDRYIINTRLYSVIYNKLFGFLEKKLD